MNTATLYTTLTPSGEDSGVKCTEGSGGGRSMDDYGDPRFKTARYAVLVTGPSATADIEGVLIHGAQGVGSLTVASIPL
jgi:hypothetical protein